MLKKYIFEIKKKLHFNNKKEKERIRKLLNEAKKTQQNINTIKEKDTKEIIIPKILKEKQKRLKNIKSIPEYDFKGTKRSVILSNNEFKFYMKLQIITKKYNYSIFPHMRIADIIDTSTFSEFQKISSKHIDFTIVDKYSHPLLYIELDDPTHYKWDQQIRDNKKDYIFKKINEQIIRIKLYEINKKLIEIDEYLQYNYNKSFN